ncbi:hypothetical protein [Agaribacterium haliotis]|uniref:hypothetical protein n=1 Tax=Agaribacterium haliotis TaxID=2013869 RepID=UPI0011773504|nr:hypothetical protein [Agaribacterium haliotis]
MSTLNNFLRLKKLSKVIVYGYCKPEDHTHHWIHNAFYRALAYMLDREFELVWLDNEHTKPVSFFENALILTNVNKGKVDVRLPVLSNSFYLVHNHKPAVMQPDKYQKALDNMHAITYEVYRGLPKDGYLAIKNEYAHFYSAEEKNAILTWGTDLLPEEIDKNIELVKSSSDEKRYNYSFVGSIWESNQDAFHDFVSAVANKGKHVHQFGSLIKDPDTVTSWAALVSEKRNVDLEENQAIIRSSELAPAIQGYKQLYNTDDIGNYIPCRIFKNISYGAMGVTNNMSVHRVLNQKTIYDSNVSVMVDKAEAWLLTDNKIADIVDLMQLVKAEHTYINRIESLITCLSRLEAQTDQSDAQQMVQKAAQKAMHYNKLSFYAKSFKYKLKRFKRRYSKRS